MRRAALVSWLEGVWKSSTLNKSCLYEYEGDVRKHTFKSNLNICRLHQEGEIWYLSHESLLTLPDLSTFYDFCCGVRKYVCQIWVNYHLQIIITVYFNWVKVPYCDFNWLPGDLSMLGDAQIGC